MQGFQRVFGLACALSLWPCAAAVAGPLEDGQAAAQRGDWAAAAQAFETGARAGQPEAEYNLAVLYDHGAGVAQDPRLAAFWYRKAAAAGQADADVNLGILYAQGRGVRENPAEAARLFREAAARGNSAAANDLTLLEADQKAPAQAPASTTPNGPHRPAGDGIWVQVGAVRERARAAAYWARLHDQLSARWGATGFSTEEALVNGRAWTRILAGPFQTPVQAEAFCRAAHARASLKGCLNRGRRLTGVVHGR